MLNTMRLQTHQFKELLSVQNIRFHILNTQILFSTLAFLCLGTPLAAQDGALGETYAQIENIKAGNEELRTLLAGQKLLINLALEDPIAAQSALKPYAACETSVLKPYCPWFKAVHSPQTADNN